MNNDLDFLLAQIDLLKGELEIQSHLLDEQLPQTLAIEYSYQSNRIGGSTLTPVETEMAIKIGLTIPGKAMWEYLSAINHYQAILFIREQVDEHTLLSETLIKQIHAILLRSINREQAGIYRTQALTPPPGHHAPPPASELPELMAEMLHWLRLEGPFVHPVIFAAEAHQRLLSLHPFIAANGTCARLLMNFILLQEGYPLVNLRGNAESCRAYFHALELAHAGTDKTPWFRLIAEQLMNDIKGLLSRLEPELNQE
jgi:Fic family protein